MTIPAQNSVSKKKLSHPIGKNIYAFGNYPLTVQPRYLTIREKMAGRAAGTLHFCTVHQ